MSISGIPVKTLASGQMQKAATQGRRGGSGFQALTETVRASAGPEVG
jgi:hypothetical protein